MQTKYNFFYQKVIKQQFYKTTKTCKNIFELFFMLRNHKLMQNAFFIFFLGLGHAANFRNS
jgi:hypothetical protein